MTHRDRRDGVTLLLVRHGRCADGAAGLIPRRTSTLCDEGRAQIIRLARSWSGQPPQLLFASDLARSHKSAEILAREWHVPLEIDSRLAEASFGKWEGQSWTLVTEADARAFRRWSRRWATHSPPEGESLPELCGRVSAWTNGLLERADCGSTVVAVTHAGVVRAMLITLMDIAPKVAFGFGVAPATVTSFVVGRGTDKRWCEVAFVNSDSFQC